MNILLLGSGGREHALAWKIASSRHCDNLFIAPGNAGTSDFGVNVDIQVNDFEALKVFSIVNQIEILVVGPEEPLVNGVYEYFKNDEKTKSIIVVGPSAEAAQLEGSKAFSKKFMERHSIPTAGYAEFSLKELENGKLHIENHNLPIVLKADGLAAGKGVIIAETHQEAHTVFENMLVNQQFGEASNKVVIEEFLKGIEVSVFVLTDGKDYQIIGHAKDYKRIGEGDQGLNTGGMGCVSPVPFMDETFMNKVENKIIQPTIKGLFQEGLIYTGFVFFGLMNVKGEPFVIEYNCRMGDPETEVVLPLLETDLVALFAAMDNGTLSDTNVCIAETFAATIVAVSGGYPGVYEKGKEITIKQETFENKKDRFLFHAGSTINNSKQIVTNGGRVLAITSYGDTIGDAASKCKEYMKDVFFEGIYYRKDIGFEFQ